jgi:hypothetical protein
MRLKSCLIAAALALSVITGTLIAGQSSKGAQRPSSVETDQVLPIGQCMAEISLVRITTPTKNCFLPLPFHD